MKIVETQKVKVGDAITAHWANGIVDDLHMISAGKEWEYNRARQITPFAIDSLEVENSDSETELTCCLVLSPGIIVDYSYPSQYIDEDSLSECSSVREIFAEDKDGETKSLYEEPELRLTVPINPPNAEGERKACLVYVMFEIDGDTGQVISYHDDTTRGPRLKTKQVDEDKNWETTLSSCMSVNTHPFLPKNANDEYLADDADDWSDAQPQAGTYSVPIFLIYGEKQDGENSSITETQLVIQTVTQGNIIRWGFLRDSPRNAYNTGEGKAVLRVAPDDNDTHQEDGEPFHFRRIEGDTEYPAHENDDNKLQTVVRYKDTTLPDGTKDEQSTIEITLEEPQVSGSLIIKDIDCDDEEISQTKIEWTHGMIDTDGDLVVNNRVGGNGSLTFKNGDGDELYKQTWVDGVICNDGDETIEIEGGCASGASGEIQINVSGSYETMIEVSDGCVTSIMDGLQLKVEEITICNSDGTTSTKKVLTVV